MTRFLPLTRGGWPAEVLCETTGGVAPLCVKHMLPNGNVAVEMHLLNGWYYRGEESPYDLIPAPEPSEAAVKVFLEKLRDPRNRADEERVSTALSAAYAIDGIAPQQQQQQPDRVAELEAEVARLTAEVERFRAWVPSEEAIAAWGGEEYFRENLRAAFRHDFPPAPAEKAEAVVKEGLSDDRAGLGRFGWHPNAAIDFCVQVETLESRLHQAMHDTIRAKRVIIWGLIAAVVGLAVLA